MVLRAGGIMHSSEHGKPSEDEEGTWSVKTGEVSFFSGIEVPKPLRFQPYYLHHSVSGRIKVLRDGAQPVYASLNLGWQ
jgi:hypothetical protein